MIAAVAISVWAVLVLALLVGNHRWHQAQRSAHDASFCAPIPDPPTQADVDVIHALLADDQESYDRAFADIVASEGMS